MQHLRIRDPWGGHALDDARDGGVSAIRSARQRWLASAMAGVGDDCVSDSRANAAATGAAAASRAEVVNLVKHWSNTLV
jgi:hypothetical protein